MSSSDPDEIERLGLLYETAVAQQEALQDGIKQMARLLADLKAQPEATSTALQRVTASAVGGWMDQAGQSAIAKATATADRAAAEFSTLAKRASADAKAASEAADSALSGVKWWAFALVFLAGLLLGSVGLYLLHRPQSSPVQLDPAGVAEHLKPALVEACKRR